MRANSIFSFEEGISTRECFAREPFRIRVNKSAMGSVVILPSLPASLHHAGNFSLERVTAETDAAHFKLAEKPARTSADPATVPVTDLVLQLLLHLRELTGTRHALSLSLRPERNAKQLQQLAPLCVVSCGSGYSDVHALDFVHPGVIDLREDQLVLNADRVIAAAVEGIWRQPFEVADTRQNDGGKAVEKFVHALSAQSDHAADGHAFANLKIRNRLLGARNHRLLPGNLPELGYSGVEQLDVCAGLAHADVNRHLRNARDGHPIGVPETLRKRRDGFFSVLFMQTRNHFFSRPLALKSRVAAAASAHFGAVRQRGMSCAGMFPASRTEQHHIGNVNRSFPLEDAALNVLRRIRARVALAHVRVLDRDRVLPQIHRQHFPALAFRAAGHHFHHVAVPNAVRVGFYFGFSHRYHTSGASEMILVNFFSRSSRATGPKTRVPIGSPASLISTAALSSNRM